MRSRIGLRQVALAGLLASPFVSALLVAASNDWSRPQNLLFIILGPGLVGTLLLWLPITAANVTALLSLRLAGARLGQAIFHLGVGVVAGVLLVGIINFVAANSREIGGTPLGPVMLLALAAGAVCNAISIVAVWFSGVKPARR